jgi:hypothetical protein
MVHCRWGIRHHPNRGLHGEEKARMSEEVYGKREKKKWFGSVGALDTLGALGHEVGAIELAAAESGP